MIGRRVLRWSVAIAVLVGSLAGALGRPTDASAALEGGGRHYRPPVQAPITDPFRLPPQPWLRGNRGIEYATAAGSPVRAIGPGVVVFAGPVAGALFVTVQHPDGLRSSYSYLAAVRVRRGEAVAGGQLVGVAGVRLHLGVRRGDAYLDPAGLWGERIAGGRAVLVPVPTGAVRRAFGWLL